MGGIIGKIFFQFGVTVAFAVLVSLFVSFTLDPMLSSVWADPEVEHAVNDGGEHRPSSAGRRTPSGASPSRSTTGSSALADHYPRWLAWALGPPRSIVLGVAVGHRRGQLPHPPEARLHLDARRQRRRVQRELPHRRPAPASSTRWSAGREIADFLQQAAGGRLHLPVGRRWLPRHAQPVAASSSKLKPRPRARRCTRSRTTCAASCSRSPACAPTIRGSARIFGGGRQPIQVNVQGPEASRLKIAADAGARGDAGRCPAWPSPTRSEEGDIPQLDVHVDRQEAWRAGAAASAPSPPRCSRSSPASAPPTWEDPLGFSHDVIVVFPDSLRTSAADVAQLAGAEHARRPRTGLPGDGAALAGGRRCAPASGPQQIERRQLEQQVTHLAPACCPASPWATWRRRRGAGHRRGRSAARLPRRVHAATSRTSRRPRATCSRRSVLAVVFIYLILASLFGSFLQPLAIMLALPLSFIGVVLALLSRAAT